MELTVDLKMYKLLSRENGVHCEWPETFLGYSLRVYNPALFSLGKYGSSFIVNFLWYIFTFGKFEILYLLDENTVAHYSYITPKSFRFPFMGKADLMVGPCFTAINYRGKGIYTNVLNLINAHYYKKNLWICATIKNTASLKAIEKSGYSFYSFAKISRITKIVTLNK